LAALILAGMVAGVGLGGFLGWHYGFNTAADRRRSLPNSSILCKPGPWGDLSYTPFTIAAPDDLLPIRSLETEGVKWLFKGYTSDSFVTLLQSTSLKPEDQQKLLAPDVFHLQANGVLLTPSADLVMSLPTDVRDELYTILAAFTENEYQFSYVSKATLNDRFSSGDISPSTMDLFRSLCSDRGNYLMFSGLSALLSRLPSYTEKLHFVKALTSQRTMLMRLHITPQTDIDTLAEYWGKGCWDTDVRTILKSLTAIPDGTWMNILMVLPPGPSGLLYSYPTITDNPMDGPPVNRDCHWTSLNFFLDVPNPNFGKADYAFNEIKTNYFPIPGDPRYGDLVLFSKPDGSVIHSAIYIADDICYTKNGATSIHPWMLATVADLLDQYSCQVPPDQKLTVSYFRNKGI